MENEELSKALEEAHGEKKKVEEMLGAIADEMATLADKMRLMAAKLWLGHPEE